MSVFLALALLFSVASAAHHLELQLALEDEFDTFNLSLWKHEITLSGGGNWEFQAYLNNRSSSFVKDGILYIKPTLMEDQIGLDAVKNGYNMNLWGGSPADYCTQNEFYGCERTSGAGGNYLNPIKSARLRTADTFSFKYGKVEIKAKLPVGDWLWPSIRLFPKDQAYGRWPTSGDMILVESRGNSPSYLPGGYDKFGSVLHWGHNHLTNNYDQTLSSDNEVTAEFHTYGLIWNETFIGTYFDDETNFIMSVPVNESFWSKTGLDSPPYDNPWTSGGDNAPFDQEFYLIMGLACGGTNDYFPDGFGKPWNNTDGNAVNKFYDAKSTWYPTWNGDNSALQIDSVKVWTYVDPDAMDSDNGSGSLKASLALFVSLISMMLYGFM